MTFSLSDSQHLWTLMVEEADLLEQLKVLIGRSRGRSCRLNAADASVLLQIIKDFYLLGRGELYQVFIDHAQHMLKAPPTAVTEHGNPPTAAAEGALPEVGGASSLLTVARLLQT